jgi:predicted DNA-binding transcriptional regulator YafY
MQAVRRHHPRVYERAIWVEKEIRAGRYPNARMIAERFEISAKTAQRVIDFMRDRMGRRMEYSAEHRGWYYGEPQEPLPAESLTHGEIVLILLAERLARQYGGSPVGRQIEAALAKVAGALTDSISVDLAELSEAYSFEAQPTIEVDAAIFHELVRAKEQRRRAEIRYFTASRGEETERRVDPLHLRNHQGDWYVIAFDHLRNRVSDFLVGRVREVRLLEERFEPPDGFDLQAYLDAGFQMIRGSEPVDVVLVFDDYQSRWVRERPPVRSATLEELPGGELRVTFRVTALESVRRYVLQYGAHVRVEAPEALSSTVAEEARRMASLYAETPIKRKS